MNVFFTLVDPSTLGRMDYFSMSQQVLMECLVANFDAGSLQNFRDKSKDFKDVSEWVGVKCNGEGDVVRIDWYNTGSLGIGGSVDFRWIPPTVEFLRIVAWSSGKPLAGSLDLRALPGDLKQLRFESCEGSSSISFEVNGGFGDIPQSLEGLEIAGCVWDTEFCLTNIPNMLQGINITHHKFGTIDLRCDSAALKDLSIRDGIHEGTISFLGSPPSLRDLNLEKNELIGSLSFQGLAPSLESLLLGANCFHGIIALEDLPYSLVAFTIGQFGVKFERIILNTPLPEGVKHFRAFSTADAGTIDFRCFPQAIETIWVYENQISGSVRIAHLVNMRELTAGKNLLEGSIEFRNLPDNLRVLDLRENKLTGTVDLSALPQWLGALYLQNNGLSGSFVIESLPLSLHTLDLSNNQFEMEALVVPIGAKLPNIDLRGNGVEKVTNIKGIKLLAEEVML